MAKNTWQETTQPQKFDLAKVNPGLAELQTNISKAIVEKQERQKYSTGRSYDPSVSKSPALTPTPVAGSVTSTKPQPQTQPTKFDLAKVNPGLANLKTNISKAVVEKQERQKYSTGRSYDLSVSKSPINSKEISQQQIQKLASLQQATPSSSLKVTSELKPSAPRYIRETEQKRTFIQKVQKQGEIAEQKSLTTDNYFKRVGYTAATYGAGAVSGVFKSGQSAVKDPEGTFLMVGASAFLPARLVLGYVGYQAAKNIKSPYSAGEFTGEVGAYYVTGRAAAKGYTSVSSKFSKGKIESYSYSEPLIESTRTTSSLKTGTPSRQGFKIEYPQQRIVVDSKGKNVAVESAFYGKVQEGLRQYSVTGATKGRQVSGVVSGSSFSATFTKTPSGKLNVNYYKPSGQLISSKEMPYNPPSIKVGAKDINTGSASSFDSISTPMSKTTTIRKSDIIGGSSKVRRDNQIIERGIFAEKQRILTQTDKITSGKRITQYPDKIIFEEVPARISYKSNSKGQFSTKIYSFEGYGDKLVPYSILSSRPKIFQTTKISDRLYFSYQYQTKLQPLGKKAELQFKKPKTETEMIVELPKPKLDSKPPKKIKSPISELEISSIVKQGKSLTGKKLILPVSKFKSIQSSKIQQTYKNQQKQYEEVIPDFKFEQVKRTSQKNKTQQIQTSKQRLRPTTLSITNLKSSVPSLPSSNLIIRPPKVLPPPKIPPPTPILDFKKFKPFTLTTKPKSKIKGFTKYSPTIYATITGIKATIGITRKKLTGFEVRGIR